MPRELGTVILVFRHTRTQTIYMDSTHTENSVSQTETYRPRPPLLTAFRLPITVDRGSHTKTLKRGR